MTREEIFKIVLDLAKDNIGPLIQMMRPRPNRVTRAEEEELYNLTLRPVDFENIQTYFPTEVVQSLQELTTGHDELIVTVTRRPKRPVRMKPRGTT